MEKSRIFYFATILTLLCVALAPLQSVKACHVDPKTYVFQVTIDGNIYEVSIYSNSTISNFSFDQSERTISFNAFGWSDTTGFCNVTFPIQMMGGPYLVFMDGSPLSGTETSNATHVSIHFTYQQNNHIIEVVGTTIAPEFPTIIANMLVLSTMALMLLFTKRRIAQ